MALIDLVQAKVKDDSGRLTEAEDYISAVNASLERYSLHRPSELILDVQGAGIHDVNLPDQWVDGFSQVLKVEFPIGEIPEALIADDAWRIYRAPDGPVLRLIDETPLATASLRLTITVPRQEASIQPGDLEAVANLAASFCCDTLANLFASTSDPTIAADVVNYRSKSTEYARRAKELRRLYQEHMGINEDGSAQAAMTLAPAPAGCAGLTHWRR
ncbi:MAG: hypothetical protein M0036_04965 [Desulfobacteraceae bacterium]|nr:hypothetical protein [Desulfobacteraceae bacterium]